MIYWKIKHRLILEDIISPCHFPFLAFSLFYLVLCWKTSSLPLLKFRYSLHKSVRSWKERYTLHRAYSIDSCYLDLSIVNCSMTKSSKKYEKTQQANLLHPRQSKQCLLAKLSQIVPDFDPIQSIRVVGQFGTLKFCTRTIWHLIIWHHGSKNDILAPRRQTNNLAPT